MELWKDIKGYEGLYQVSNLGRVKSLKNKSNHINEIILKQGKDRKKGYMNVSLSVNSKTKTFKVHKLVATHFIPNIDNKLQVNHKNGDKSDNRVINLEWVTCKENIKHAWNNNLCHISEKHRKSASEKAKKRWEEYRRNNESNRFVE